MKKYSNFIDFENRIKIKSSVCSTLPMERIAQLIFHCAVESMDEKIQNKLFTIIDIIDTQNIISNEEWVKYKENENNGQ